MSHARIPIALIFAGLVSIVAAQQRDTPADLLLLNGRVYTLDAAKPWAEGVAVRGSQIVAVGSNADVRAHGRPQHPHD